MKDKSNTGIPFFPRPARQRYTQVPNVFFELCLPQATLAELRVLGVLLYHTRGRVGRRAVCLLTREEIMAETGLANGSVTAGVQGCVEKGWALEYRDGSPGRERRWLMLNDPVGQSLLQAFSIGALRPERAARMDQDELEDMLVRLGIEVADPPIKATPTKSVEAGTKSVEAGTNSGPPGVQFLEGRTTNSVPLGVQNLYPSIRSNKNKPIQQHQTVAVAVPLQSTPSPNAEKTLIAEGIEPAVARELIEAYGAIAVLKQVEWLQRRHGVRDRAAFLVEAIRRRLPPPAVLMQEEEARAKAEQAAALERQIRAELTEKENQREQALRARWEALGDEEQEAILAEARRRLVQSRLPERKELLEGFVRMVLEGNGS